MKSSLRHRDRDKHKPRAEQTRRNKEKLSLFCLRKSQSREISCFVLVLILCLCLCCSCELSFITPWIWRGNVLKRNLKQDRTATAGNRQLNFNVQKKPQTTYYVLHIRSFVLWLKVCERTVYWILWNKSWVTPNFTAKKVEEDTKTWKYGFNCRWFSF